MLQEQLVFYVMLRYFVNKRNKTGTKKVIVFLFGASLHFAVV